MIIIRSRNLKRKLPQEAPLHTVSKKLRSKIPRRRRRQISPVLVVSPRFKVYGENRNLSVISVDSSSSSGSDFAGGEVSVSCDSSRISTALSGKGRTRSINEISSGIGSVRKGECVSLLRNRRFEKRNENEMEVSENSCVDSNSGVRDRSRSLILKFKSGKENDEVSEVTFAENSKSSNGNLNISSEITRNDVVSVSSGARETSSMEEKSKIMENRASESEFSQISRNRNADENCTDLIAQSIMKNCSDNSGYDSDLACSEEFNENDDSEYYSSQATTFSDLHSEIFGDCSDYSPSQFLDSSSQFSQGSVGETPSHTYSLFLQYRDEFMMLGSPVNKSSSVEEDISLQLNFSKFEDLDDEDSYQMLRKRERRQVFIWNYAERYFSTTKFTDLVFQQRSKMVHWIIEQSYRKHLRQETMFLGINLLDRFLSKGYFKAERNLQIVGIACLTLATRIEENQQYNRVGQKNFYIEKSAYSRCEVVAMEWMVQEVLEFECFHPTIYNFLSFYLKAANADAVVEKRVTCLALLALAGPGQLCYWPSTIAAAVVILACLEFNQKASHKVIGIHIRSKDENLHDCMEV
ncbi:cyclin-sds-like protein [Trifolium pratense]|uniref:B-like cyclin n=2 Tax=Trifolium pratense TaxID=57577 RepID=A0A2K3PIY4_TRIPR|nr:cyclin-sds-like protein [Trifolium pratense]